MVVIVWINMLVALSFLRFWKLAWMFKTPIVLGYVSCDDFKYSRDNYYIVSYFENMFASISLSCMLDCLALDYVIE